VQLYDGSTPITPVTQVESNGDWSETFTGLSVAAHTIKAKARYGTEPESAVRAFTVAVASAPTIASVQDAKGEVPPNGTTFDTSVIVSGKASPIQNVQLHNGNTPIGPVTQVNGNGDWSQALPNLSVALHTIKAKALYGTQPESAVRAFTVAVASAPTIASVQDAKGEVPPNGTTFDTSVIVSGKASPDQTVQLYDGSTPITPVTQVESNGDWSKTFTGLSVAAHTIKAKALYGAQPESAGRAFTVAAHTAPTLNSVRDASSEVQNGGQTTSSTVTLQGTVTPGHQVQIFDNGVGKHTVTAVGANWTTSLTVVLGSHAVKAKAVTTGQDSNTRSFTVISPTPPLNFNASPVTLSGKIYLLRDYPAVLPAFGPGTSVHHQATGGQPGYLYTSSNPAVAAVDTTGLVTVRGRGTTSITARDAANQSLSYTVTVTGVIHCIGLGEATWGPANASAAANGARLPNMAELLEIHLAYNSRWPMGHHHYWSTDPSNYWWPWYKAQRSFYLVTGGESSPRINGDYALVVALR
jgi:CxxC motif-containing protein